MKNLVTRLSRRLWFSSFGFCSYRTPSALPTLRILAMYVSIDVLVFSIMVPRNKGRALHNGFRYRSDEIRLLCLYLLKQGTGRRNLSSAMNKGSLHETNL